MNVNSSTPNQVLHMQYADVDLQQYQIKMKHEPRQLHDAIDTEYAAAVKLTAKGGRRPVGFDAKSEKAHREAEGAPTPNAMAALVRKSKKRWDKHFSTTCRRVKHTRICSESRCSKA